VAVSRAVKSGIGRDCCRGATRTGADAAVVPAAAGDAKKSPSGFSSENGDRRTRPHRLREADLALAPDLEDAARHRGLPAFGAMVRLVLPP